MDVVEINPGRCELFEDEQRDRTDFSVVHAKDDDNPGWTLCGMIDEERECCRWKGKWDGNTVCVRCDRRICPSCLAIGLAWFSLGRYQ